MADENVYNYNYDIVINNDSNLEELKKKAECLLADVLRDSMKDEY